MTTTTRTGEQPASATEPEKTDLAMAVKRLSPVMAAALTGDGDPTVIRVANIGTAVALLDRQLIKPNSGGSRYELTDLGRQVRDRLYTA